MKDKNALVWRRVGNFLGSALHCERAWLHGGDGCWASPYRIFILAFNWSSIPLAQPIPDRTCSFVALSDVASSCRIHRLQLVSTFFVHSFRFQPALTFATRSMGFEPHLHWSFADEHVLLPSITLHSWRGFIVACFLTVVVCLFERCAHVAVDG